MSEPSHHGRVRPLAVAFLAVGIALSATGAWYLRGDLHRDRAAEFEVLARDARTSIDRRIDSYNEALLGLRTLFVRDPAVGRDAFRRALESSDAFDRYAGVRAFSFNRRVLRSELTAYEEQVRADTSLHGAGYQDFEVRTSGTTEDLYVIEYLEPIKGNEAAFGFDIGSEPSRRRAVEEARDSGSIIATAPVRLIQEEGIPPRTRGLLITLPVYDHDGPPLTGPSRRRTIVGVIVAVVDPREMLAGVLGPVPAVEFEVYDVGPTVESPRPITRGGLVVDTRGGLQALHQSSLPEPHAFLDLDASGRRWRLLATPGPAFVTGSERALPWVVGVGGSALSLLATGMFTAIAEVRGRRRRQAFDSYLEITPDAVVVVDETGVVTHANAHAEELFGYRRGELFGLSVETLLPERMRTAHAAHRARYVTRPVVRPMGQGLDLRGRRRDGAEIDVDVRLAPVHTEEGLRFAAVVRDATPRRKAERALERALQREQEAAEGLRQADQLKDEFLGIAAHELRTPLMSISGFVELLARRGETMDEPTRADFLERVAVNAENMVEMVERLLDVSRLAAGRVRVDLRPLTLRPAVEEAIGRLGDRLSRMEVSVEVPDTLAVVADADGLGHVLTNLLSNAAKFSEEGGAIRVVASISPSADGGRVRVEVADEGVGIPPDEVPHLFDRFFQGSNQMPGVQGTGVGLSIVKRYVELMDGEVTVTSEPGRGSTFAFTLPQATTPVT